MEVTAAVQKAGEIFGYTSLKEEQLLCMTAFIEGNDVFCILPTGYGKTVCFACLPQAFDLLHGNNEDSKSIIVVVSPLTALMKDQVEALRKRKISVGYIDSENEKNVIGDVNKGKYSIVMMSPEMLMGKWRGLLASNKVYHKRLVGIVVDEAHCVVKWGLTFRECFARIGELRSLMERNIKIMALTATATNELRKKVSALLCMIEPYVIALSPDKANVLYAVREVGEYSVIFRHFLMEITTKRTLLPRIIIFCKNKGDCGRLYTYFKANMGQEFTDPPGASEQLPDHRLIDMYFQGTEPAVKDAILKNFTSPSRLRIVICTVAFGMGVDCSDIRMVIHLGAPSDIEMYVQEVGRGGRDGLPTYALLLNSARLLKNCSKAMLDYCSNARTCRRTVLFQDFEKTGSVSTSTGCDCCDICGKSCNCNSCKSKLQQFYNCMPIMFGIDK